MHTAAAAQGQARTQRTKHPRHCLTEREHLGSFLLSSRGGPIGCRGPTQSPLPAQPTFDSRTPAQSKATFLLAPGRQGPRAPSPLPPMSHSCLCSQILDTLSLRYIMTSSKSSTFAHKSQVIPMGLSGSWPCAKQDRPNVLASLTPCAGTTGADKRLWPQESPIFHIYRRFTRKQQYLNLGKQSESKSSWRVHRPCLDDLTPALLDSVHCDFSIIVYLPSVTHCIFLHTILLRQLRNSSS